MYVKTKIVHEADTYPYYVFSRTRPPLNPLAGFSGTAESTAALADQAKTLLQLNVVKYVSIGLTGIATLFLVRNLLKR